MSVNITRIVKKVFNDPSILCSYAIMLCRLPEVRHVNVNGALFYKFKGVLYPEYLNNGNAASFIRDKALSYCKGKGLDIGADDWPLPGATPVFHAKDLNAYKLDIFPDGTQDFVFSSHCLEHLDRWDEALKLWIRKLKIGGILFLYLPHESMLLWRRYGPWVGVEHKWAPTYQVINKFLTENGLEIVDYNSQKDHYWSFHIIARKIK